MYRDQPRNVFQQYVSLKIKKLQMIYLDVCGPIQIKCLGSKKYFVLIFQ